MKTLLTLLFLGISFGIFAQKDSSYYNPNIVRKLYYLKPLQKVNGVYFYGERRMSSYNSLEVPFFELNNPEVNFHYRRYKTFTGIGQAIGFIPTIYVLATLNKPRTRQTGFYTSTYLSIIGATLAGSITCSLIGKSHIKKAAIKYNQALGQSNVSNLQFKTDENSLGLALRYNF
ncbi:hypothetical protein GCM10011514_34620 [Emticicia aquatilis]|uniref:Uncharacterized protein n=1 Tax=Emticicia aquatilis TaxID=1537369 RepID=A0A917DU77_9BACT|nr:hypothetical protein [Emticicia aquatilis]GGD67613.1 hypothetical protein GCM10011514_34620 [Emticicia aquatilis]